MRLCLDDDGPHFWFDWPLEHVGMKSKVLVWVQGVT